MLLLGINMPNMNDIEVVQSRVDRQSSGAIIFVKSENFRVLYPTQTLLTVHHLKCIGMLIKPINWDDLEKFIGI